jgi:hypothetical protein
MDKLNLDKNNLKKFGIVMGIAFLAITLFINLKHKSNILPTYIISIIFFILAFTLPILLKPIYIIWMRFAYLLAWINTRLILCAIFYLVFTPIGLVMRLLKIDPLDRKIDKNKNSYWIKKEKKDFCPLDYERQF